MLDKSYLRTGFWLAIIIPAIFIFSKPIEGFPELFKRFGTSFLFILGLWVFNFSLIDFKNEAASKRFIGIPRIYLSIAFSILFSIAFIILIGFTIDSNKSLLSQVQREKIYSFRSWFYLCLRITLFDAVILLIKYLFDTKKEKQRIQTENERLTTEMLQAQHEALKEKVNPHFLFNSLYTLKALVKREPSLALSFIDELSSVYRQMLSHQQEALVPLKEEISFLTSYLYLLKMRFGESFVTNIAVGDSWMSYRLPPNTLQLLAENAVKHNVLTINKPLYLSIYLDEGFLVVKNNMQLKPVFQPSSNIGLNNIKSRYLLTADKEINITKDESYFQVMLPLINPI